MSTVLPPPPAAPPPSAVPPPPAESPSAGLLTERLVVIGIWRRRRKFRESIHFANADPPTGLTEDAIDRAVPEEIPQIRGKGQADNASADLPPLLERARLWSIALHREVLASGLERQIRGVKQIGYGFVANGPKISLAVIFYVHRIALLQAAPLWLRVEGAQFPIVLRPPYSDLPTSSRYSFADGLATGRARLRDRIGTLTAAHVVAQAGDKHKLTTGDMAQCITKEAGVECKQKILAVDPMMDAALIDNEEASGLEQTVLSYPYPGYIPIEVSGPNGQVSSGWVVEVPLPQGVVPGTLGKPASAPAQLLLDIQATDGWSGGLVSEVTDIKFRGAGDPRPYGMFLGVRALRTGVHGRMNMLRQLEIVWGLELLDKQEDPT